MKDIKIEALIEAINLLNTGRNDLAEQIINNKYPFNAIKNSGRNYTIKQMMEQFFIDGFIDRYSGKRLINPGMLRALSEMMPSVFPYQAHWKTDECHIAYWDYQPTVDHIYPVSLGGKDSKENWATTSMVNNSAKSNFTLEQLNWTLKDKGDIKEWDGLSKDFIELVNKKPSLLKIKRINSYYTATKELLENYKI
ncbi:MAG: HNH endonuclease [Clostridia bacterium]|nr:HNH endonuclease [Clostridia bacterium]